MAHGSRNRRGCEQLESRPGTAPQPRASGALQPYSHASLYARTRHACALRSQSLPGTTITAAAALHDQCEAPDIMY